MCVTDTTEREGQTTKSSTAVSTTGTLTFQFMGEKDTMLGVATTDDDSPDRLPLTITETTTADDGALDNRTVYVADVPSAITNGVMGDVTTTPATTSSTTVTTTFGVIAVLANDESALDTPKPTVTTCIPPFE